jgi:hypothetical protein
VWQDSANFAILATLEKINSSVLFEFEVRSVRDPNNVANFKFSTLVRHSARAGRAAMSAAMSTSSARQGLGM